MEAEIISIPSTHHPRSNFRREAFARSTDKSTVEDMADLVVHRVIGQAANCIERSLGMKFSMESLKVPSLNEEDQQDVLNLEDADSEITITTVSTDDEKPTNVKPVAKPKQMEIPISKEFSKDQGIILVEHIIETWNLSSALWERHIELINDENSPNMLLLCYKVIFYPIGKTKRYIQITACVDFTLTISHLDPQIPVKVEFRLEGQRFRHEPGQFRFREKWLSDIIDHKKKLIRQVSL